MIHLQQVKGLEIYSADTILREISGLTNTVTVENLATGVKYGFNVKKELNELLVKSVKLKELLKKGGFYDLDYDNQFRPKEKYDTEKTGLKILWLPTGGCVQQLHVGVHQRQEVMKLFPDKDYR
jgi:hypothetical protein